MSRRLSISKPDRDPDGRLVTRDRSARKDAPREAAGA